MADENVIEQKIIPAGEVFTFGKAILASFFGDPLVIGYMLSKNYETFGNFKSAKIFIISSLLIVIIDSVLEKFSFSIGGGSLLGLWIGFAFVFFHRTGVDGARITNHINTGGKSVGWGKTMVVCILGTIFTAITILGVSSIVTLVLKAIVRFM